MASKYLKSTVTLLSGTGIGQLLSIMSLPLLVRLYSSAQMGEYFLVIAIAAIGSSIFSFQSHLAIVLGKTRHDALSSLSISIVINIVAHLFFLGGCYAVLHLPFQVNGLSEIGNLLLFSPLLSLFLSLQLSFEGYLNYLQAYKKLSKLKIYRIVIMIVLQLLLPLLWQSQAYFLILAQLIGLVLVTVVNLIEIKPLPNLSFLRGFSYYWHHHKEILVYNTGISAFNTLSNQLPYLLINSYYGADSTGFYGMAQRIVGTPLSLFGQSLGVVFYQKGAQLKNHYKRIMPLLARTLKLLLRYGGIPLLLLVTLAKPTLSFFFGKDWELTGTVVQIIVPWLFLMYINSAISYLVSILKIQKMMIWYEMTLLGCRALAIWAGYMISSNFLLSVGLLSGVGFVFNLLFLFAMFYFTHKYEKSLRI